MKKHVKFQKVLANAQKSKEAVLVVGPSNGEAVTEKEVDVSQHTCTNENCATTVVVNTLDSPFCPTCAGVMEASGPVIPLTYKEIKKELVSIAHCDVCDHEIGSTANIAKASDGTKLYCTVCATPVTVTLAGDDEESYDDEDMEDEDYEESEDESEDESEEESEEEVEASDDEEITDESEDEMGDDESEEEEDEESSESEEEESEEEVEASDDETIEAPVSETPAPAPVSEAPVENAAPAPVEEKVETIEEPKVSLEVAPLDAAKNENMELDLVASVASANGGLKWYLMANDSVMAIATAERASPSVKSFFDNQVTFKNAFLSAATAENADDNQVLADFGFTKVISTITVDQATAALIEAKVAEKTKASVSNVTEAAEKYKACFSIASLGLRKGTFGKMSPLYASLVEALTTAGMANANTFVANLLETAGKAELELTLAKASELMNESPDALNATSAMVESAISAANTVVAASVPTRQGLAILSDVLPQNPAPTNHKPSKTDTNVVNLLTAQLGSRHYKL